MKIGLVLSKTPAYSETFFINKIESLQQDGYKVELFVQKITNDFQLCESYVAPKVYRRPLVQFFMTVWVILGFLPQMNRLFRFIRYERLANRSNMQILKNIYTNAHILKANVDWLHFGFGTLALQSEHVAKAIEAKMAVSFRGFDISIYPIKHVNCYDLLWKNVDKLHVISNDILNLVIKNGFNTKINYQKITPAINTEFFKQNKNLQKTENKAIQMLTIARLHWKKGLMETLEALSILRSNKVLFNYNIIGSGVEYESLKFAIYQLNLEDVVSLVGQKTHEEIKDYMRSTEVYLQYSISEGFCNAVLEAQAMGLLCVVSDAEGLSENVLHGQTGWIVPKRNPKALADKISEVINLPETEKNKITSQARQRVKDQFNLTKHKGEWLEFYQNS